MPRHGLSIQRCGLMVAALLAGGCGASSRQASGSRVATSPAANSATSQFVSDGTHIYRVRSGSMEPTLRIGQRVTVTRGQPAVGAIVLYHPPEGFATEECGPTPHVVKPGGAACVEALPRMASIELVKRIVAGPGDEIYIREGHVYRRSLGAARFAREDDSYIRACAKYPACDFPTPIKIPADHWFLMGDNRKESDDSRFWGAVPTGWIVGLVEVR